MEQTPDFSERDIESLKYYFEVNKKYNDKISAELRAELADHPVFGSIIKSQTPEQVKAQSERSQELQRAAIFDGKWKDYSNDLVAQGIMYARMNVNYKDWYILIKDYKTKILPVIKKDFRETEKAIQFIEGMDLLLDYAMYGIAQAYFTEKNNMILAAEAQFRAIFENSADTITVVNKDLQIVNMNRIRDNSQYKMQDLLGRPVLDLQRTEQERQDVKKVFDRVFQTKAPLFFESDREVDNKRIFFSSSVSPILNSKGEVEKMVFVTRDITAQKQEELQIKDMNLTLEKAVSERTHELTETNKELEQFAYVASHDLQEPLRNITNYVGLLEETLGNSAGAEAKKYFGVIVKSADRMKTLIRELLNFSRVGRDRTVQKLDCNQTVQDVLADFESLIKENNAEIKVDKLPVINSNETEMKQLFQNLISNAIKFRKNGQNPVIHIHCKDKGSSWEFSVSDNGIGIEEEYLNKIFLLFQRLHNEYPGTGIGLAICKKIADLHKGKIWITSTPGKGSTFHFTISK